MTPAMNAKRREALRDQRIGELFRNGLPLDRICELGLVYGWSRSTARHVVTARGWALDWTGRLQARYLAPEAYRRMPKAVQEAEPERLVAVGIDHETREIRKLAVEAGEAIDALRAAFLVYEARQADMAMRRSSTRSEALGASGTPSPAGTTRAGVERASATV